ncbi:MAG TPA: response regulator [Geminicoccaceae bacterium]|nr:response regulator [Geminicoccaceae bacterium]
MADTPSIIVVDDEPDICEMFAAYLGRNGIEVRTAADGAALRRLLLERPADLVVLDVNLPGEDGFSIARELRAASPIGIVMLTGAGAVEDRVAGLQQGADDYVPKPVEPRELLARIRSVLRRVQADGAAAAPEAHGRRVRFGRCVLDLDARRLAGPDGGEIPLTAMEFDLLAVFVRHPNQVLSRDRLSELAHNRPLDAFDRSIDIRITRLRHKIEPDPAHPQTIRTVRGEGYVFATGE